NYQRIENNRTFRVETYYKKYDNLVKVQDGVVTNHGNGYAQGVEVFWRDNESVSRLDYWISYSFLDTKRNYLNFPTEATPTFASKHNFSVVGKYFIEKMKSQLGATFSYTSPRPYNNPNESTFNGGKTPSYQDLSFTWSYLPKPNLIVFFSCTNLLGRDNIFGYEYGKARNEDGLYNSRAIRQPAPRFLFLGIFLTISKDKSVNQLPTL
ncbi:MAG TPA: TonB-dependent receptor, partial [Sphingobacteriaceae bacterium]